MNKTVSLLFTLLCIAASLPVTATEYLNRDGWVWYSSSICEPEGTDIAGLEGIHDDNPQTCWHSNWHAASGSPERSNPHWVMIDRGSDTTPFYGISYIPRQSQLNTHCLGYMVYFRDEDMSDTPATSVEDIIAHLGTADLEGSWEQSYNEKTASLRQASSARYILFVNTSSYSSSSAACAEFNLLANKTFVGTGSANAVKITPADGSEAHRIAIDGTNLTISMTGPTIRMSNSGITVEYSPEEISYFSFEEYAFDEDAYYVGSKSDIYDNPFDLMVTPEGGDVIEFTDITITAAIGAIPTVNPSATGNVTIKRGNLSRRAISPARMKDLVTETGYVITALTDTVLGDYTINIPEGFFLDASGCRNNALSVTWTLIEDPDIEDPDISGIEEAASEDCPTLTLKRDGNNLIVGGVTRSQFVTLTSTTGVTVAKIAVNGHGYAVIPLQSLGRGVYLLSANKKTIKITL